MLEGMEAAGVEGGGVLAVGRRAGVVVSVAVAVWLSCAEGAVEVGGCEPAVAAAGDCGVVVT